MKKYTAVLITGLVCVMLVVGLALAKSSANFSLPCDVTAGGGNKMASTSYVVESTISQTSIGPSGSTSYQMGAGYWYGIPFQGYDLFLPIIK